MCASVHMCAGVRACEWHLEGGQLFSSSPCFLRQGLSLNLKLTDSAGLAGCLPSPGNRGLLPHLAFYVGVETD